ncbi:MAG TPA: HAD-IA family hydrolase [Burkholderiales bacterium]|jgi:phosphoglycolate phosphatase|nr:HAD-IA family hydrolase [Burkholderiales bacterium]
MPSRAVLFDFDGTLADTAPDLAAAVNRMRVEQGYEAMPLERLRPFASAGARGLLQAAFRVKPDDAEYKAMRQEFLDLYAESCCGETRLFPGIAELLRELAQRHIRWGVVTNKATRFTERILAHLELKPDCVACGDTTPHLKPHPAPLLHAAGQMHLAPSSCWFLGDDLRDMKAARAAGMRPVAVEWGYHHPESGGPNTWEAEAVIAQPMDLVRLL